MRSENPSKQAALPATRVVESAEALAVVIREDVLATLRLGAQPLLRRLLTRLGTKPSLYFARLLFTLEHGLPSQPLRALIEDTLATYTGGWQVSPALPVPHEGPLLVVANHPGVTDALGMIGAVGRQDFYFLSDEHPLLRSLPNISSRLVYLPREAGERGQSIREVVRLLRAGACVMLFPRGKLEPDPALVPGALRALDYWSESIGIFLNKAPGTRLLPMLMSQTVAPKAWPHIVARLGKTVKQRQQYALVFQTAMQSISQSPAWRVPLKVDIGSAYSVQELSASLDPREINGSVREVMSALLLKNYPQTSPDAPGF